MSVYLVTFASSQYFRSFASISIGNLVLSVLMLSASHLACLSRFMDAVPADVAASVAASNACFDHRRSIFFPLFWNRCSIRTVDFIKFLVILQGFPQKVEKPCFWRWEGDIPGCAWFSPSLSAAAASCRRLRAHPLSVPVFRKDISFFPFYGCSRLYRQPGLVGAHELGGPLLSGPPCQRGPEPGHSQVRGSVWPGSAPRPGPPARAAPQGGPLSSNMTCIAHQL